MELDRCSLLGKKCGKTGNQVNKHFWRKEKQLPEYVHHTRHPTHTYPPNPILKFHFLYIHFSFKQQDEQKKYPVLNLRSKVSHLKKDENFKFFLDWEGRVQQNRKAFEEMSATAKSEINIWEGERVRDTKAFMTNWMKDMLEAERKIVKMWEQYLPKA